MKGKITKKFDKLSASDKEDYLLKMYWDAEKQCEYWRRMLAKLRGKQPFSPIDYERPDEMR